MDENVLLTDKYEIKGITPTELAVDKVHAHSMAEPIVATQSGIQVIRLQGPHSPALNGIEVCWSVELIDTAPGTPHFTPPIV